jgi:hypothetical protein
MEELRNRHSIRYNHTIEPTGPRPTSDRSQAEENLSNTSESTSERNRSDIVDATIASCSLFFALIFGIFTILSWAAAENAEKSTILQNQLALLQYCAPNVRDCFNYG